MPTSSQRGTIGLRRHVRIGLRRHGGTAGPACRGRVGWPTFEAMRERSTTCTEPEASPHAVAALASLPRALGAWALATAAALRCDRGGGHLRPSPCERTRSVRPCHRHYAPRGQQGERTGLPYHRARPVIWKSLPWPSVRGGGGAEPNPLRPCVARHPLRFRRGADV